MARNPVICGRKNCSRCKRWLHIMEFPAQRRVPLKLQSQCRVCAREVLAEWYAKHPGKRAEYSKRHRDRDPDEFRRAAAKRQAQRRQERKTAARMKRQSRKAWKRMRKDPARWAERLEKQRAYYAKRNQDPEWVAVQQAKRHERYVVKGGREEAALKRAREKLRRHLAAYLVVAMRAELERREVLARERRRQMSEWKARWARERRERWERGEVHDVAPIVTNGELRRLPVGPLAQWIMRERRSIETLAESSGMNARTLRRWTNGESLTVDLGLVDEFVIGLGDVLMLDIYDPGIYSVLYEVGEPLALNGSQPEVVTELTDGVT